MNISGNYNTSAREISIVKTLLENSGIVYDSVPCLTLVI